MDSYFLNELQQWSREFDQDMIGRKASRVHRKALKAGKVDLAGKIKAKYGTFFPKPDDLTVAFMYCLLAQKKD